MNPPLRKGDAVSKNNIIYRLERFDEKLNKWFGWNTSTSKLETVPDGAIWCGHPGDYVEVGG